MHLDPNRVEAVLDVPGTLSRLGGDQQLFRDMLSFFLEDVPPLMADLRRSIAERQMPALRSLAHAIKGLAAGCGGDQAARAAQRIETAAANDDMSSLEPLQADLEDTIARLINAARQYRD